jgi:hypothetical protein
MVELFYVYATAGVIAAYFLAQVVSRRFDPFAPTWLFLVGYVQLYVIQPLSYHDWAVATRGVEVVAATNWRALWALLWFLAVYHLGPGRRVAPALPRPPRSWSPACVWVLCPPLILWGLYCSGVMLRAGDDATRPISPEEVLFRSFAFVLMVAAILLIVTGRTISMPRPSYLPAGLACSAAYVLIWMFNGKRSHSLIAVLSTVCALYVTRLRRPSWPVLFTTGFTGALVVAIAIGWRNDREHERSAAGFVAFLGDFRVSRILESLNVVDGEEEVETYESEEYGGFLLMMDTVPHKSDYDYGANYLRVFSTFIPRIVWPSKPIFGRSAWINAWIAGSEMDRDEEFTGPAIGLMGATQLNGGAIGTLIVVACVALLLRAAYEYFRLYAEVPWVQFWWAITYYNSWFMITNDDPMIWFYYNWGFCVFPTVLITWFANKRAGPAPGAGKVSLAGAC